MSFVADQVMEKFALRTEESDLVKSLGMTTSYVAAASKVHDIAGAKPAKPWRSEG